MSKDSGLLEKIGQALIAAAGCGGDLECGGYGNVSGRVIAINPEEGSVVVEVSGMGPGTFKIQFHLLRGAAGAAEVEFTVNEPRRG